MTLPVLDKEIWFRPAVECTTFGWWHSQETKTSRARRFNFVATSEGPTILDAKNPAVNLIIKGQEILGCIIDGSFRESM